MNYNRAIIAGNVTKDPEIRMLPAGTKVASFSVATNRHYTSNGEKQQETEFHNIVLFGKLAELAESYIKKGGVVLVEGRIQTRNWEKDGVKHYRTEIVGESIQLGPKKYE